MPLVKDNALVAAASEKYKIKQFGKTLNTYTFAQLPAHKKHKHENLLTTSNTNTFLHQVQIPSHIKYKYLLTSNTNTFSHQIQIPSHNDAVFVASDTLPFVADCMSEILTWSASTL